MKTRHSAPNLTVQLVEGGDWHLHEQNPERFTLVVFYRGAHCSICHSYLKKLQKLNKEYAELGARMIFVSGDNPEGADIAREKWGITGVPIGFGLDEAQMHQWNLFISRRIKDDEPEMFCEPGFFLVRPGGELYYAAINSAPFGRPDPEQFLESLKFIVEEEYPARGEV